jgi:hypothetical protein
VWWGNSLAGSNPALSVFTTMTRAIFLGCLLGAAASIGAQQSDTSDVGLGVRAVIAVREQLSRDIRARSFTLALTLDEKSIAGRIDSTFSDAVARSAGLPLQMQAADSRLYVRRPRIVGDSATVSVIATEQPPTFYTRWYLVRSSAQVNAAGG